MASLVQTGFGDASRRPGRGRNGRVLPVPRQAAVVVGLLDVVLKVPLRQRGRAQPGKEPAPAPTATPTPAPAAEPGLGPEPEPAPRPRGPADGPSRRPSRGDTRPGPPRPKPVVVVVRQPDVVHHGARGAAVGQGGGQEPARPGAATGPRRSLDGPPTPSVLVAAASPFGVPRLARSEYLAVGGPRRVAGGRAAGRRPRPEGQHPVRPPPGPWRCPLSPAPTTAQDARGLTPPQGPGLPPQGRTALRP